MTQSVSKLVSHITEFEIESIRVLKKVCMYNKYGLGYVFIAVTLTVRWVVKFKIQNFNYG